MVVEGERGVMTNGTMGGREGEGEGGREELEEGRDRGRNILHLTRRFWI